MLFNSYLYILAFLPLTLAVFFFVSARGAGWKPQVVLVGASLFFYAYWDVVFLPVLLASIGLNFFCSRVIWLAPTASMRRNALIAGITTNLFLLGYFKYVDFAIQNINSLFGTSFGPSGIQLPLGISFFTFTQIAFLVDTYRRLASRPSLVNYALFVSYFPHLLAGPILHHREMMPQFEDPKNWSLSYENFARGLFLFSLGLAKKVLIADNLSPIVSEGYDSAHQWQAIDAWLISLAYTLQLYFDFSGYTDMAIGASLMFNIRLPINFNSPYKAFSIQDFWRRWHMTLSRFLREYLYIPLGGSRWGEARTVTSILVTFLLGGLWHGAGWTFVVWGALHGLALCCQRLWAMLGMRLPRWNAWVLTFLFVNLTWVYFRAPSVDIAHDLLEGMCGLRGMGSLHFGTLETMLVALGFALVVIGRNSNQLAGEMLCRFRTAGATSLLLVASVFSISETTEFIYFNF